MRYKTILPLVLLGAMLAGGGLSTVFALTADEALKLRKAGVSDETIRMMIQQEKEGDRPVMDQTMGKREIRDGDDVSVEYSTGGGAPPAGMETQQQQVDRAWEMLQRLIVDTRKTK
jgi:hypothetical protein